MPLNPCGLVSLGAVTLRAMEQKQLSGRRWRPGLTDFHQQQIWHSVWKMLITFLAPVNKRSNDREHRTWTWTLQSHQITQFGRDLRVSPVQPPAPSRVSHEIRAGYSGAAA